MNLFNRGFAFIVLLALLIGAIGLAVLSWTIPDETIEWLRDGVNWMDDNDGNTEKAVLSAILLGIALIALVVLVFEILPRRRTDVQVTDLQGGTATLSSADVAQRIEERVRQVPNVADAKAFVQPRRKGVEVAMDLHVDPDANLAEVTNSAIEAARDVLSTRMHVALAGVPTTRLHYRELRLRRSGQPEGEPMTSSNTTVVPTTPADSEELTATDSKGEVVAKSEAMPPRSEAAEAGWRAPGSPDNTEARPEATHETPPADKSAKPEPETENKFE